MSLPEEAPVTAADQRVSFLTQLVAQSCPTSPPHGLYLPGSSVEFSRKEYWSGLPFLSPRDVPDPGIEPRSPHCKHSLPSEPPGKLISHIKEKAVLLQTGSLEYGASWIFQRWHLNSFTTCSLVTFIYFHVFISVIP